MIKGFFAELFTLPEKHYFIGIGGAYNYAGLNKQKISC
jgi:hypothetical protein